MKRKSNSFPRDKICIIGIDGFTGRNFHRYIQRHQLEQQYEFIGISRTAQSISFSVKTLPATDRTVLLKALITLEPNYIVNLVGSPQVQSLEEALDLNANITRWICELIIEVELPIKKILAIGSAAEYGIVKSLPVKESDPLLPVSLYGLAKTWQTNLALYYHRKSSVPINIARTFNIIGPGMPNYLSVGSFIQQLRADGNNSDLLVGNLQSKRDFLTVDDVVDAYWKILITAPAGEVYNVCRGQSFSMDTILRHLIAATGKKINLRTDPLRQRAQDLPDIFGDNSKLRQATSWEPRDNILEGLTAALNSEGHN